MPVGTSQLLCMRSGIFAPLLLMSKIIMGVREVLCLAKGGMF